jgi:uncharacterized protein
MTSTLTDRPVTELVLKVASRCDLACDYCYIYELGDTTWKTQPRFMSQPIADIIAGKTADYIKTHNLNHFRVIFHGGEPLLAGAGRIQGITEAFRRDRKSVV